MSNDKTYWQAHPWDETSSPTRFLFAPEPVRLIEATGWQKHTIRGFVSILGSKGGEVEPAKNANRERTYRITK